MTNTTNAKISVGNQGIDSQGINIASLNPNNDYLLLFHYSSNNTFYLKLCTNKEGTNVSFEYTSSFTYTAFHNRNTFYINSSQSNSANGLDGSITDITVSNQLSTWDQAFNYEQTRNVVDSRC